MKPSELGTETVPQRIRDGKRPADRAAKRGKALLLFMVNNSATL